MWTQLINFCKLFLNCFWPFHSDRLQGARRAPPPGTRPPWRWLQGGLSVFAFVKDPVRRYKFAKTANQGRCEQAAAAGYLDTAPHHGCWIRKNKNNKSSPKEASTTEASPKGTKPPSHSRALLRRGQGPHRSRPLPCAKAPGPLPVYTHTHLLKK